MSERRPKKRPNVFAQVVANADEVVQASFIASGPAPGVDGTTVAGRALAPVEAEETAAPAAEAVARSASLTDATAVAPTVPAPASAAMPSVAPVPEADRQVPRVAAAAPGNPVRDTALKPGPAVEPEAVASPVSPAPVAEPVAVTESEARPEMPTVEPSQRLLASIPEPAPVVAPKVAPKAAPRRRQAAPARPAGQGHWSHQAVLESFASATIDSRNWRLHGFRLVPEVLTRLKVRINADRRSTGNPKLAISHYLDAALRHTPTEVEEQITLAQDFLTVRMGMVEAGKQSTYRVGPQASAWVSDLNVGLQEADYGRKGIYVVSASIESFLAALDDAGELQRPELPGMR